MHVRLARFPQDLEIIRALVGAVTEFDGGTSPLGEAPLHDISRGPDRGSFGLLAGDGDPCAYVHAMTVGTILSAELVLDGDHRAGSCPTMLLGALSEQTAARGYSEVGLWVHTDDVSEFVGSLDGWEPTRTLIRMETSLPPDGLAEFPSGTTAKPFRIGMDERAWLELNNSAFSGHPEQGGWTRADLEQRFSHEWFDPVGLRMAWFNEKLVAFNWTKLSGQGTGEIYVIASSGAVRGKGLGRAIALEGLWDLYTRQLALTASLHVDLYNATAVGLYESIGFRRQESHRFFTRKLDAAER